MFACPRSPADEKAEASAPGMAHARAAESSPVSSCFSKESKGISSRCIRRDVRWLSQRAIRIPRIKRLISTTCSRTVQLPFRCRRDVLGAQTPRRTGRIRPEGRFHLRYGYRRRRYGYRYGAGDRSALRNHKMIILEYDNEGYMNTGAQLSYSTPLGHRTSTSNVGKYQGGKTVPS